MMSERKKILLVDPHLEGLKELKSLLMQKGYRVGQVDNSEHALQISVKEIPDAVICEALLPGLSGGDLLKRLRRKTDTKMIVFLLLAEQKILDDRINLLELGADDFVPKPFHPQEVLVRLENIFSERERYRSGQGDLTKSFSGTLTEMSVIDLIEIFTVASKSGVLHLQRGVKEGLIYVADGIVVDATLDALPAQDAITAMVTWEDGFFQVEFQEVTREQKITVSTEELLVKGFERLNEWAEVKLTLPPLDAGIEQNSNVSLDAPLTADEKQVLALLEKSYSIRDIIVIMGGDELKNLKIIKSLFEKKQIVMASQGSVTSASDVTNKLKILGIIKNHGGQSLSRITSLFESEGVQREREGEHLSIDTQRVKITSNLTHTELLLIRERLS